MQWRLVEQAAAETATGFKKEKAHTPMGKPNWLRKEISNPRLARYFNKRPCQGLGRFQFRSSGPWRPVSTSGYALERPDLDR